MVRLVRAIPVAAALVVLALPSAAWACPSCAGSESSGVRILLMFVMIFLPFAVAYVAYRLIRKAGTTRDQIRRYL